LISEINCYKASATPVPENPSVQDVTHPIVALQHHVLRPVPITAILHSRLEVSTVVVVKVGEDSVLVLEPAMVSHGRSLLHGCEGAGGRSLGADGAGGEVGEGGGGRSRRSRYHDGGLRQFVGEDRAVLKREGRGSSTQFLRSD
jgi:hypothetical protein